MKTKNNRFISLFLALVTILSVAVFPVNAADNTACLRQNQSVYKQYVYGTGSLYNTGCGIFALSNTVYALTGKRIDPVSAAKWAHSIGAYNKSGAEGSYRDILYPKAVSKYGDSYGFTNVGNGTYASISSSTLISHLKNGGVAIGHVPSHFIAIVGYNSSTKKFHVHDSYPSSSRGTSDNGGDVWLSASQLSSGKMKLDWFYLLASTSASESSNDSQYYPIPSKSYSGLADALSSISVDSSYTHRASIAAANSISGYSGTAAQNTKMRDLLYAGKLKKDSCCKSGSTAVTYFKKCASSYNSLVDALQSIGADSSYSYRKKIAAKNSIVDYTGSASQNTQLLNLLKKGKLIKP